MIRLDPESTSEVFSVGAFMASGVLPCSQGA